MLGNEYLGRPFVPAVCCGACPVMKNVFRPRWVAACLLCFSATGFQASAQFLDAETIAALEISPEMRTEILELVGPAAQKLVSEVPKEISAGRQTLVTPLRDASATTAFKTVYSELLAPRVKPAATHESVLVRINAMIVLARMTDDESKALINAGLDDASVAVQRKVVEALQLRVQQYLLLPPTNEKARQGIADALAAIDKKMSQQEPPHPFVFSIATRILLEINSAESRSALVGYLIERAPLHAANSDLSLDAERSAIERLASFVATSRSFPQDLAPSLARATHLYAQIGVDRLIEGELDSREEADTVFVVDQCLKALLSITNRADKAAPNDQIQADAWVREKNWSTIRTVLKDGWALLLKAEPFSLTDQQLTAE